MKTLSLVQPIPAADPELVMPKHFKIGQRRAWEDLLAGADDSLHVRDNQFMFEIAATLMAKFRSGKAMNATETKELKKQLVALGLAKDDDARPKKSSNAAKYFDPT